MKTVTTQTIDQDLPDQLTPEPEPEPEPEPQTELNYHLNFPFEFFPHVKSQTMRGYYSAQHFKEAFEALNLLSPVSDHSFGELGASQKKTYELFCDKDSEVCPDVFLELENINAYENYDDRVDAIKKLDFRSPSQGHCVLNHPDEYKLKMVTSESTRSPKQDDGSEIWLEHFRVKKGINLPVRLLVGAWKILEGTKLWLNIMRNRRPHSRLKKAEPNHKPTYGRQDDFFESNTEAESSKKVGVGPRTTSQRNIYEYLPACQDGYSCLPAKKDGDVTFYGDVQLLYEPNLRILESEAEEIPDRPDSLDAIRCIDGEQCSSGICTPQSKRGLIANWGFTDSVLANLEMDPDLPHYSRESFCQPIRRCYRPPTPEFGQMVYEDDYCAPGLTATANGMCIDTNIGLIDLNRVPQLTVNTETCTVKMRETDYDGNVLPEPNSPLYCSLPGFSEYDACVSEDNKGVWNRVQVKMAKLSRLMLGLEWMWSKADMKNVTEPEWA